MLGTTPSYMKIPILIQLGEVVKFGFSVSFFGSIGEMSKKNEPSCNMFGVGYGFCPILGAGPSKPAAGRIIVALMGTS